MTTSERSRQPGALRVVSGLQGQLRYVRASREDASADRRALHKRHVVDPYWGECAAGGELESLASVRGLAPIMNLVAPPEFSCMCNEIGLQQIKSDAIPLKKGKAFFVGVYRKKN